MPSSSSKSKSKSNAKALLLYGAVLLQVSVIFIKYDGLMGFVNDNLVSFEDRNLQATTQSDEPAEPSFEDLERMLLPDGASLLFGNRAVPTEAGDALLHDLTVDTLEELREHARPTIHPVKDAVRCQRYGLALDANRKTPRRLFFAGLLADDSLDVLQMVSTEMYGMFHTVAFLEANLTQSVSPREWSAPPGSAKLAALARLWGPNTSVSVDYRIEDPPDWTIGSLHRESHMRYPLIERWKRNGMTADDVGIVSDPDETFTRDFLRALRVCDVPMFKGDCKVGKVIGKTMVFESAPNCITKHRRWFHPDAIVGACIDGIGDSSKHPPSIRHQDDPMGFRSKEIALRGNYTAYHAKYNTTAYPLWTADDFRMSVGGDMVGGKNVPYTAFHFHNFFSSAEEIRHKYTTYGHADHQCGYLPLRFCSGDLEVAVACRHGVASVQGEDHLIRGGFADLPGDKPYLLRDDVIRETFQQKWNDIIDDDESIFGSGLDPNVTCPNDDCKKMYAKPADEILSAMKKLSIDERRAFLSLTGEINRKKE